MKKQAKCIVYNPEWKPDKNADALRWVENASDGLRIVGACHDILPRGRNSHTGWYTDDDCGETVHGAVLQLPGLAGKPRYVPDIADPGIDDCYAVSFGNVTEDKEQAATWADSMAEAYAERAREYSARESARMHIDDARDTIIAARVDMHTLAAELRAAAAWRNAAGPAICAAIKADIAAKRASVARAVREIRDTLATYGDLTEG